MQPVAAGLGAIDVGVIGFARVAADDGRAASGPVEIIRAAQAVVQAGGHGDAVIAVRGHGVLMKKPAGEGGRMRG